MKKVLICDFDGTLINKISEIEFIRWLVMEKKMRFYHYVLSVISCVINIIPLSQNRGTWLKAWTAFRPFSVQNDLIKQFAISVTEKLYINRTVLEIVKGFSGQKILLTGCYDPLVKSIVKALDLQSYFDDIIGAKVGMANFLVTQHAYGRD